MQNVVLLFPGQGSQAPGMGKDLAERFPLAREVFEAADVAIDAPLSRLCFEGPAEELTRTLNAQPALLTHGAAVWAVVRDAIGPRVVAAAGHSLGEFTAYHAADALSLPEAVRLVRARGELMFEAGVRRLGAMAAVLGALSVPIEEICEKATEDAGVAVPANFNCPGQIVISGEEAGVERAMELAKAAGAKAKRLNVSGAFHSPLMESAAAGLSQALDRAHLADPRFPVYANVNAQPVKDAALARRLLVEQLTSPVQWTREVEALAALHPDALYVEMGPGTVLKGLVKKIAPQLTVLSCGTGADVDALLALVAP
ncbi:MAG TPA: ACP S-malonyltransferase [Gemmatimonadaceae bacterium]|nr:ACP S-malonyltransferase [Gemmatimonadaceae bacterium]